MIRRQSKVWSNNIYSASKTEKYLLKNSTIGNQLLFSEIANIEFTCGTASLRGHPSHAKDQPLAVQRQYLHFSVILRP